MRLRDTTADARAVQLSVYRSMTPDQRTELAVGMSEELREVTLGGLRERHAGLTDEELAIHLVALWHGAELAERAARPSHGS